MSVYRHKGSPFYHYDFQLKGRRFYGSTGRTNQREAQQVERSEREKAAQQTIVEQSRSVSLKLNHVIGRYWDEVGRHHAGHKNTWRDLCRLIDYFGPDCQIDTIGDDEVARLVSRRRGDRVVRRKGAKAESCPFVSPATVNRSTIEPLKKLFTRAKTAWGVKFENEPRWRTHILPEPQERVRELVGDEDARLEAATRADYLPFFAFAKASGLRLRECLLRWPEVNWDAGQIQKKGKGSKLVTVPITAAIRSILEPLLGDHPEYVFTYVAMRTRNKRVKGARYPLTYSGAKITWRRLLKVAQVSDLRFHDLRHDLATKVLRLTGNLKLVQRLLNHANLKTTLRYAHVLDSEVAEALEKLAESRNSPRNNFRKVS